MTRYRKKYNKKKKKTWKERISEERKINAANKTMAPTFASRLRRRCWCCRNRGATIINFNMSHPLPPPGVRLLEFGPWWLAEKQERKGRQHI